MEHTRKLMLPSRIMLDTLTNLVYNKTIIINGEVR